MALRSAGGASIGWNCPFLSDMPVRPFAENDIPQVADLYWTVLRQRHGLAEAAARHGVDLDVGGDPHLSILAIHG